MHESHVPSKISFAGRSIFAILALKWFLASMCADVLPHMKRGLHDFGAKWTSPRAISKSDWIILQNGGFSKTKQLTNLNLIRWFIFIFFASRMMFQNVHLKIAFSIGSIITHSTFIRFFSGMNHLMSFQITCWAEGFRTNSTCPPSIPQKQAHLQNTRDQQLKTKFVIFVEQRSRQFRLCVNEFFECDFEDWLFDSKRSHT